MYRIGIIGGSWDVAGSERRQQNEKVSTPAGVGDSAISQNTSYASGMEHFRDLLVHELEKCGARLSDYQILLLPEDEARYSPSEAYNRRLCLDILIHVETCMVAQILDANTITKMPASGVVDTDLDRKTKCDSDTEAVRTAVGCVRENGYFIFNPELLPKLELHCDKLYPVTYGFNGKTTITASSVDETEQLCLTVCIQRSVISLNGSLLQPYEKTVSCSGDHIDVNSYLAIISCLLVLGLDI